MPLISPQINHKEGNMKVIVGLTCLMLATQIWAQGNIKIYDGNKMLGLGAIMSKGQLVVENNRLMTNKVPSEAVLLSKQFQRIQDYYANYHSRNSWDDQGADIEATVNIRGILGILLGLRQNAAWIGSATDRMTPEEFDKLSASERTALEKMSNRFIFGKGTKRGLGNFEESLEVVAHEFTHAVIDSTSKLKYEGQSGALNEHLADVFGVLINIKYNNPKNPFLIGKEVTERMSSKPIRDMEYPSRGMSAQPGHMNDLKLEKYKKFVENCKPSSDNDHCGVHILSGIPNRMAVEVIKDVTLEEATQLFYNVMTTGLNKNSDFADYKNALLKECSKVSMMTCSAVEKGFAKVGL
jgi:bacillolysin